MDDEIRKVLAEHGRLLVGVETLDDDGDLYQAGLTSHANVTVMLQLEDAFDVEFPDTMLRRSTFESIAAIRRSLEQLDVEVAPAGIAR